MATFLKTTQISIERAHTLPREYFTSPDIFREELEKSQRAEWTLPAKRVRQAAERAEVLAPER